MKLEIFITKQYKKDLKKASSTYSKSDLKLLIQIINNLANNRLMESKYRDHALSGNYSGSRECHVKPDLLLVYKKYEEVLVLERLGSHSELF